jgi:hypothetical protein
MPEGDRLEARKGRRPLHETVAGLLAALCHPRPLAGAWTQLAQIVREEHGPRADAFLATALSQSLARLPENQRGNALTAVAEVIVDDPDTVRLIPLLSAEPSDPARHLAIALANLMPPPLEHNALLALRSLLLDQRLADDVQMATTAILLRTTGKEGAAAGDVLRAFVHGLGKARSVERLRQLETALGPFPALTELAADLEDQVRMICPRCNVELRRRDMIPHLWEQHRLVLDGRRVREPWQMIEEWIEEQRRTGSAELLGRCKAMAQSLDGEQGLLRVQRKFLARGILDTEALQAMLAEAAANRASLCPHCYALVSAPLEAPVRPLNRWHGRLSAGGYRVEVTDAGMLSRLEIETPTTQAQSVSEGTELHLTRQGAMILVSGPFVLFALVVACGLLDAAVAPLWPVLILLTIAGALALGVGSKWPMPPPVVDRAVDHAWSALVPRLHAGGFSLDDSAFVAALALSSTGLGRPQTREAPLKQMLALTEKAVAAGRGAVEHLAALRRLAVTDAARHRDPVPLVVEQIGRCFEGELPLAFAEQLLDEWQSDWWTHGNLLRLRILLCDQAFEAGFEVLNLVEAGQVAPTLGAVLETDDADWLARLRLLWSLRGGQSWQRCGDAQTVFELAEGPESSAFLERWPDLLLYQKTTNPRAELVICGRGLVFEGKLFRDKLENSQAIARRRQGGTSHELVIDGVVFKFRTDAEWLGGRLEEWFKVFEQEFTADKVESVHGWRSQEVTANLLARETVPCPECRRPVVTHAGQVGGSVDEERS